MSQEFGLSSFVLTATDHLAIFSMPVEQQIFVVLYPHQQLQLGALKSESLCSPFPTLCICLFPVFKYLFVFHNFLKTFLETFLIYEVVVIAYIRLTLFTYGFL